MRIIFFNILFITFFQDCLLGLRFDTSKLPTTFNIKLFPFYKFGYYIGKHTALDYYEECDIECINRYLDIMIPYLCDIEIIKEIYRY